MTVEVGISCARICPVSIQTLHIVSALILYIDSFFFKYTRFDGINKVVRPNVVYKSLTIDMSNEFVSKYLDLYIEHIHHGQNEYLHFYPQIHAAVHFLCLVIYCVFY